MQFHLAVSISAFLLCLVHKTTGRHEDHTRKRYSQTPSYIEGPSDVRDRIAIVGGGPSGVHMAYLLKQKGFRDVTILEKRYRAGGKSHTVNYRGASHEVGTCYLAPGYEESIIPLIKKYTSDTLIPVPSSAVWLDGFKAPMTYKQYVGMESMKNFNTTSEAVAFIKLVGVIEKYILIHQRLFGNYTGTLMPKPSAAVMHEIRGTFMEFLQRNGLTSLQPLFLVSHTMQGYGHLDETAALYGLIWNTPTLMKGMLRRIKDPKNAGFYILKHGFQRLWEAMIYKEKLNVEYGINIGYVYREEKGSWLCTKWHTHCQFYHFVIWSPELGDSLKKFENAHEEEIDVFGRMKAAYFTTSIVDTLGAERSKNSIERFLSNIIAKRDHSVCSQRDSYASLHGYSGPLYQNGSYPSGNDGKPIRTTVGYQFGKTRIPKKQLKSIMEARMKKMGASYVNVKQAYPWRYSPKFNPADIQEGIIWDIVDMQGKYGMWYIGSSVIFESVKSVVEYNKMLISKMKPPSQ